MQRTHSRPAIFAPCDARTQLILKCKGDEVLSRLEKVPVYSGGSRLLEEGSVASNAFKAQNVRKRGRARRETLGLLSVKVISIRP